MKKLILAVILAASASCSSLKDFTEQDVQLKDEKSMEFQLRNNQMVLPLRINGKTGKFLFDTGAASSAITGKAFIEKMILTEKNYKPGIKLKGATGIEVQSYNFITDSISSEILSGQKNIFKQVVIRSFEKKCGEELSSNDGILGFDILERGKKPILLDFEKNTVSVLQSDYSAHGYELVESRFSTIKNKIMIPMIVEGRPVDFLFDTGNSGGLLVRNNESRISDSKKIYEISTIVGAFDGYSVQNIKRYSGVEVQNPSLGNSNSEVTVLESLITNTMGISFIKKFSWIIDFNQNRIFAKKIVAAERPAAIEKAALKSGVLNDALLVVIKDSRDMSRFMVNDQILAIDGRMVTSENICEMQNLLNGSDDWSSFEIEVAPSH